MSCVDPEGARNAIAEATTNPAALSAHLHACTACRASLDATPGGAAVHPDALLLVQCQDDPAAVEPEIRSWIDQHLKSCSTCAQALQAIPPLSIPAGKRLSMQRGWVAVAAAGLLVTTILIFDSRERGREPKLTGEPTVAVVLSAQRDGAAPTLPLGAASISVTFVLAEEVSPGQDLEIRMEDQSGVVGPWRKFAVVGLSEWGWPKIRLLRSELPTGRCLLHVRSPSLLQATFVLNVE